MDTTSPYEGVIELLAQLKNRGIRTAIVSNVDSGIRHLSRLALYLSMPKAMKLAATDWLWMCRR